MKNNKLIITNIPTPNSVLSNTSLRCKTVERATEIVKSRNKVYISRACFKDSSGNFFEYNGKIFIPISNGKL